MSNNASLAAIFQQMADVNQVIDGNRFKTNAYQRAARLMKDLTRDVGEIDPKDLAAMEGVGKGLLEKIGQFLATGQVEEHQQMIDNVPPGVLALLDVPGLGPKGVAQLWREAGIESVGDLKGKIADGSLAQLKGFGKKKLENLSKSIAFAESAGGRVHLGNAMPLALAVIEALCDLPGVEKIDYAGSLRRGKETIGDIDILIGAPGKYAASIMEVFVGLPFAQEVLVQGETKSSIRTDDETMRIQIDLRVVDPAGYGAALMYFTGSKEHNVKLRTIGVKAGLKLNEYGLYDRETDELIAAEDEETIYESMGMRWMPPEIRENTGEIEAAMEDRLPELVALDQIKGDLHIHTDYSHAVDPLEHMVEKAVSMGHQYIAITDHSKGLAIAKGLSEKRLAKLIKEIETLDAEYPEVRVIKGTECDIKGDGSLDYSDDTLSQLDFVIASVHTGFQNDEEKLTQRMVDAIHNPYVKAIGHPTGRLIQRRSPYALDMDRVFEAAAEQNVFMEINGSPSRLDLTDVNTRRAKEKGVKLSLGSDAHSVSQMEFLPLSVAVARRGWLTQEDVVNTWELEKVLGYRK